MKIHPFVLIGALLVACGIAALIHPNLSMPSKKREVQIGTEKVIMENPNYPTSKSFRRASDDRGRLFDFSQHAKDLTVILRTAIALMRP